MTTIWAENLLRYLSLVPGGVLSGELYPGVDWAARFGSCATGTSQTWRTVWGVNASYVFSATAENLYVSSSSTSDIGRIIVVTGLDNDFNEIYGYGITNGQAQSIVTSLPGAGTPVQFFRVNHAQDVTPALVSHSAVGNIYIATADAAPGGVPAVANTRAYIAAGESYANGIVYTTPRGKAAAFCNVAVSQRGDQQIEFRALTTVMLLQNSTKIYLPTTRVQFAAVVPGLVNVVSSNVPPAIMSEMTDFSFQARGTSPVSGTATMSLYMLLLDYKIIKNLRTGWPLPI